MWLATSCHVIEVHRMHTCRTYHSNADDWRGAVWCGVRVCLSACLRAFPSFPTCSACFFRPACVVQKALSHPHTLSHPWRVVVQGGISVCLCLSVSVCVCVWLCTGKAWRVCVCACARVASIDGLIDISLLCAIPHVLSGKCCIRTSIRNE